MVFVVYQKHKKNINWMQLTKGNIFVAIDHAHISCNVEKTKQRWGGVFSGHWGSADPGSEADVHLQWGGCCQDLGDLQHQQFWEWGLQPSLARQPLLCSQRGVRVEQRTANTGFKVISFYLDTIIKCMSEYVCMWQMSDFILRRQEIY